MIKQIFQETSFSSSRLGSTVKVSVIKNDMNIMFSFCYLVLHVKYLISNINCQYCDSIPNIWNPIIMQREIFNLLKQ